MSGWGSLPWRGQGPLSPEGLLEALNGSPVPGGTPCLTDRCGRVRSPPIRPGPWACPCLPHGPGQNLQGPNANVAER